MLSIPGADDDDEDEDEEIIVNAGPFSAGPFSPTEVNKDDEADGVEEEEEEEEEDMAIGNDSNAPLTPPVPIAGARSETFVSGEEASAFRLVYDDERKEDAN